jgi:hypothetical protein
VSFANTLTPTTYTSYRLGNLFLFLNNNREGMVTKKEKEKENDSATLQ